jgi:mycofactocin precursor
MAFPTGPPPNVDLRSAMEPAPATRGRCREDQEDPVEDSGQQSQDQWDDTGSGATADGDGVVEELLVEEVSIDGMCGVY